MKTVHELIDDALGEAPNSEERWTHIVELHKRGDDESFAAATKLLDSADPDRRAVAADILAQLGAAPGVRVADRPLAKPAVQLLLQRLPQETDPTVLQSITSAFGHLSDPCAVPALRALRDHPDEDVRNGVIFGLLGHIDDLAVETLIELSRDPDPDNRNWATFGLGVQTDRDDAQIRDALVARLDDEDNDTRGEAVRGLAVRGDERAMPRLLIELGSNAEADDPSVVEEALLALAAKTGDPSLCTHVEIARREWAEAQPHEPMPEDLREAVEACAGRSENHERRF